MVIRSDGPQLKGLFNRFLILAFIFWWASEQLQTTDQLKKFSGCKALQGEMLGSEMYPFNLR